MSKTKETIAIENSLKKETKEKRIYGCEEVTIGFPGSGRGKEIADFVTMDSKGTIRCYEIKVTIQDFKSSAAKSWYGHYNYLVIGQELYQNHYDYIKDHTPAHIGILVGADLISVRKCKRVDIPSEPSGPSAEEMKESLVRTMYWKYQKALEAADMDRMKKKDAEICRLSKEAADYKKRACAAESKIIQYENFRSYNEQRDVDFDEELKKERDMYKKRILK